MDLPTRTASSSEEHWIPLSDVMTGLMMIFMLIAIAFMLEVSKNEAEIERRGERIKSVIVDYSDLRSQLYADLTKEFAADLPRWKAELSPSNLSLRFKEPSVQFDTGSCQIKQGFADILRSFFPRYVKVLYSEKYRGSIDEIRIEGHTSRKWERLSAEQAYYKNMDLSQCRTREVLQYVLGLPEVREYNLLYWLVREVTANGLSSSKPVFIEGSDFEDEIGSQRVEFRVRTDAESRLENVIKALQQ